MIMSKKALAKNKLANPMLIMFSDEFYEHIDTLFSGCVIYEYDLQKEDIKKTDPAALMHDLVTDVERCDYSKVTVVLNYKKKALIPARMQFPVVCMLDGQAAYDSLLKIDRAFKILEDRADHFAQSIAITNAVTPLLNQITPTAKPQLKQEMSVLNDAYTELQRTTIMLIHAFKTKFYY